MAPKIFAKRLLGEIDRWVESGIITAIQKDKILSMYEVSPRPLEARVRKASINAVAVVVALAAIFLGVGIIIFYAANWQKFSPMAKLVQIFMMIILLYGASYYLFAVKKAYTGLARAFLLLGMISYGAGIMLVSQVYHISAHPTTGILMWAVGVLLTAAVMNELWGYFLAVILFLVWNVWELAVFENANYFYIVFVALTAALFYRKRSLAGILVSILLSIVYFYQICVFWIPSDSTEFTALVSVSLVSLPFGLAIAAAGKLAAGKDGLDEISTFISLVGWLIFFLPFFILSWPMKLAGLHSLAAFHQNLLPYSFMFLGLTVFCAIAVFLKYRKNESWQIYFAAAVFCLLSFCLPMQVPVVRMVSTHIMIVALMAFGIYYSAKNRIGLEMEFALFTVFSVMMILVKFAGFIVYGFDTHYRVGYTTGIILFCTVCFLLGLSIKDILKRKGFEFNPSIIAAVSFICIYFSLYALSFKIENQKSVIMASGVVVAMIILFVSLSVILYSYLISRSAEKIVVRLSLVVFLGAILLLLISSPQISWVAYSVIANALLLLVEATCIYYSTVIQSRLLLNLSVAAFILHIVTRYFDLFWDMLSGSLLFIVTGILGLVFAWLIERNRRRLLSKINSGEKAGVK